MAIAAPANALKVQFNSAQWQRLGFMAIAAPTSALKGQLNLCDVYVLSCPYRARVFPWCILFPRALPLG